MVTSREESGLVDQADDGGRAVNAFATLTLTASRARDWRVAPSEAVTYLDLW
jgi:hypothetical protein